MAVRDDFAPGEVLAAADLNDTFASKLAAADQTIIQVVRATDGTARSTTSNAFVDASLSVTITPTATDSTVILISNHGVNLTSTGSDCYGYMRISDSSNNAINGAEGVRVGLISSSLRNQQSVTLIGYATPASTSAQTYKVRFRTDSVTNTTVQLENNLMTASMYAIEVGA